ncbi:S1 family peptidase [Streptomyces sp. NPDC094034]|uniref:S1 family peptidase n=1 Tax=Streptomyces sp. NPDC094034 TaxID=3155309 RepID=UPI00331D8321
MSHTRIPKRKIVFAGGGAAAVVAAAILLPQANASQTGSAPTQAPAPSPRTLSALSAGDLAARIAARLGPAFAGAYYDKDRQQITVNVVGDDSDTRAEVARAGAVVRSVKNSTAQLKSAATTLRQQATIPGTAWAVDPRTNRIQVTADRTVTGDDWDRIESTVESLGADTARIKKSAGEFKTVAAGGDAIFGGGARCSLGFNVIDGNGAPGFLTAGHCGVAAAEWSDAAGGAPVGTVQQAIFPGEGDFALVGYDDATTQAPSAVDTGDGQLVEITGAAEATVGQAVIRMGSTTGLSDGSVTGLDATVNYAEGTVTGLIQTDVCAEPGDSGGPLFTADGSAIGLTSGGSGDCTVGGETFFQPVTTALAAVGAQIGDGPVGDGSVGDGSVGDGSDEGAVGNDSGAVGNDGGAVGNDGGAVGNDGGAVGNDDGAAGNDDGAAGNDDGEGAVNYGESAIAENG